MEQTKTGNLEKINRNLKIIEKIQKNVMNFWYTIFYVTKIDQTLKQPKNFFDKLEIIDNIYDM